MNDYVFIDGGPTGGLPPALALSSTDLIVVAQNGTPGAPATATDRAATLAQVFGISGMLPLTGGTITGDLTVYGNGAIGANSAAASLTVGNNNATSAITIINGAAGSQRSLTYQTAGVARWAVSADGTAEGGSTNGGTAFTISRYSNAGALLGTVLSADRATGLITVAGDPTSNSQVATKHYVDNVAGITGGPFLSISGGTMTGPINLAANPTTALQAVTKQYVDARAVFPEAPNNNFAYGRMALAWSLVPSLVQVANTGFDLNTISGTGSGPFTGFVGVHQITNQITGIGAVNFPGTENTGFVLSGYNSNVGWDSQLFMGAVHGTSPALYYRASTAQGVFSPWYQVITAAGGTIGGALTVNGAFIASAAATVGGTLAVNGSIGAGGPPIAGAAPGSVYAAQQVAAANQIVVNAYLDTAATWRYVGGAGVGVLNSGTGTSGAYLSSAGPGTPGSVVAFTGSLGFDPAGNAAFNHSLSVATNLSANGTLNVSGVATVGDFYSNGAIRLASSGGYFFSDASFTYLNQDSGGWRWQYTRSSGAISYIRGYDGAALFTIDPGGNVSSPASGSFSGNVNAGSNVNAPNGTVTGANIMSNNGAFYIGGNFSYYLGRNPSDGAWRFVENGTVNATLDTAGTFTTRGSISTGPSASVAAGTAGVYIGPNGYQLYDAGTDRVLQFSSQWTLDWSGSNGNLTYFAPGGPFWSVITGDGRFISWRGPHAGLGAYQDISDERMKDGIEDAGVGLAEVLAIRPIRFRRRGWDGIPKDRVEIGFSAQQLRTVIPDAVNEFGTPPRHDGPGALDSGDPILTIATEPIVAALVNSDQALHSMIQTLTGRVASLEQRTQ